MLVTICGTPGSDHTTIAKLLARRYDVPYLSASMLKSEIASDKYSDLEIEEQVNTQLAERLNSGYSYVCDSLLGRFLAKNSVSILLIRDMISITRSAETVYNNKQSEISMSERCVGENCFNPEHYDIVINVTGVDKELIVDTISTSLEECSKAVWISPKLVVPDDVSYHKAAFFIDSDLRFNVCKCYATYVLYNNYSQCLYLARNNKMLRVGNGFLPIPSYLLHTLSNYRGWLLQIGANSPLMNMSIMLSRYCYKETLQDADLSYLQLIQSGNPAKRLYDMGYGV